MADSNNLGQWIDMIGPVVEARAYVDGKLVETGLKATLPAVTNQTAEFRSMGTLNLSIPYSVENMELTLTKRGTDPGLAQLCAQKFLDIELRYMQDVKTINGESRMMPCKAFLRAFPRVAHPSISFEPGAIIESEITYDVTRYESIQDGERVLLVDKLAYILEAGGVDYTTEMRSFFGA